MSIAVSELRVRLPALPTPGSAAEFPWLALLLPPAMAVLLWLATSSSMMLMMALLGPLTAAGNALLQRRRRQQRWRLSLAAFEQKMLRAAAEVEQAHQRERAERWKQQREGAAGHWLLGEAAVPSRLRVDCPEDEPSEAAHGGGAASLWVSGIEQARRQRERLRDQAGVLTGAPLAVPRQVVLTVAGPAVLGEAVLRGILLQHSASGAEEPFALRGPAPQWLAASGAPQPVSSASGAASETSEASADAAAGGPGVLTVCFGGSAVPLVPPAILLREALGEHDRAAGPLLLLSADGAAQLDGVRLLPRLCSLEALRRRWQNASGRSLRGQPEQLLSPSALDLFTDGPHALVGGTTGSGKSEFLLAWLLGMARSLPPERLVLLLIDFKGGCGFDQLAALPHCTGLVTDLDDDAAERVLRSIGAELRHRERQLRLQGVRRIEESTLPRLVVAIDEYAALRQQHPEASRVLADLAARGRSLGVHLILATQHPGSAVDQTLLANFGLRILFRVHDAAESRALLGSPAAASIPAGQPGRAVLLRSGRLEQPPRFAQAAAHDWERAGHWPGQARPRRVWREPLPARLALEQCLPLMQDPEAALAGSAAGDSAAEGSAAGEAAGPVPVGELPEQQRRAVLLGARDLPDSQCWAPLLHHPREGALLVLGGPASGKSGALAVIASQHPGSIAASDPAALWDLLEEELEGPPGREFAQQGQSSGQPPSGGPARRGMAAHPPPVLLDDLDGILAAAPLEYRAVLEQRLLELMRQARAQQRIFALTATRAAAIGFCAAQTGMQLLLGYRQRSEHLAAGGAAAEFRAELTAGAGHLNGERIQIALAEPAAQQGTAQQGAAQQNAKQQGAAQRRSAGGAALPAASCTSAELLVVVPSVPRGSARMRGLGWRLRPGSLDDAGLVPGVAQAGGARTARSGEAELVLLEAEQCQSRWQQWQALLRTQPVALFGLAPSQYRSLASAGGELPPLLTEAEHGWLLHPEQAVRRIDFRKQDAGVGG